VHLAALLVHRPEEAKAVSSTSTRRSSAAFSKALDPASVTPKTFTVVADSGAAPVTGRVVYDPASRRARFNPNQQLLPFVTYRATITAAVKDLVGNPMGHDYVWRFHTGPTAEAPSALPCHTTPWPDPGALSDDRYRPAPDG
jgi:hypothetical protein